MSRPRKHRHLRRRHQVKIYKPVGIKSSSHQVAVLLPEEMEALQLVDVEGFYQIQACEVMGVARSTFQRILAQARNKVAVALSDNRVIVVSGSGKRGFRTRWKCINCGESWRMHFYDTYQEPDECPCCGSRAIREAAKRKHSPKQG